MSESKSQSTWWSPGVIATIVITVAIGFTMFYVASLSMYAREPRSKIVRSNLQQIGIAIKAYEFAHGCFPRSAIMDEAGRPLLSWRVQILPYLELKGINEFHKQFHLDEPWDNPHNRKLLSLIPEIYIDPDYPDDKSGRTRILACAGPGTAFPPDRAMRMEDFTDGPGFTVSVVEVDPEFAVEWTKPEDYIVYPKFPMRGLTGGELQTVCVLYANSVPERRSTKPDYFDWAAKFTAAAGDGEKKLQDP